MGTVTDSTVEGKYNELAGRAKQGVGEAVNDQELANKGAAQEVKGHAQQAWGSVKEAAEDTRETHEPSAESAGHDIREKVTSTAQNVKQHIQDGVEHFREKHNSQ